MTSNYRPDLLYPDGLHRDRLLPAIALLQENLDIMNVDAGIDYRQKVMEQVQAYFTPLGAETANTMDGIFNKIAEAHDEENSKLFIESGFISAGSPTPSARNQEVISATNAIYNSLKDGTGEEIPSRLSVIH